MVVAYQPPSNGNSTRSMFTFKALFLRVNFPESYDQCGFWKFSKKAKTRITVKGKNKRASAREMRHVRAKHLRSLSDPQKRTTRNLILNLIIAQSSIGDTDRGIVLACEESSDQQASPRRRSIKYRKGSFFCSKNLAGPMVVSFGFKQK